MLLDISPDWIPTFDNFVAGHNIELLTALNNALNKTQAERCIYIWGDTSSGKSHLLQATVEKAHTLGLTGKYTSGKHTLATVPEAVEPETIEMVAIDDVELLDEPAQIALFALYNHQRESGGMLLVSGTAAPAHLKLRDDLRTRLGWGLVYQVQPLSDEEKSQALQQHAKARGLVLPREVTLYLLRHGRRDLPALLGVLDALDEHCLRLKRAASVPLLKEVMQAGKTVSSED